MKEEIKCPKCHSARIKKAEDSNDFLSYKAEGEPAKQAKIKTKQKYICLEEGCGHEWEEN